MIKRKPLSEAPDQVKQLFKELEASGDSLVFEDEHQQPVLSVAPLRDAVGARRQAAAERLGSILDALPPNPYSAEETNALIEEAIAVTKGQYPGDVAAGRASV
ncbi:MAG: hypothetical protein Q8P78_03150 [bacterium]|nr:hypothetical protein [bacterium]